MRTDPDAVRQIERELREWEGGVAPSSEAIDNLIATIQCLNEPDIDVDPEDGAIYARWSCPNRIKIFTLCFIGNQIVNNLSKVNAPN